MKIDKLIKHQLIYFIKKFRISQEMKELFEQESGYLLVTDNIKSYLISPHLNNAFYKADLKLKSFIEFIEQLKLITWVNKGCAGEIISSPGKGELINRFNMFNKQFSFFN